MGGTETTTVIDCNFSLSEQFVVDKSGRLYALSLIKTWLCNAAVDM